MAGGVLSQRLDEAIRFLMCVLIFWLPYSQAVIEVCVILSLVLWMIKRVLVVHSRAGLKTVGDYMGGMNPPESSVNGAIGIFLAICVLSVLNSIFWQQALHGFITKTLEWFVIYFLIIEVFQTRRQIEVALVVFAVTMTATAVDGLIQFYVTHRDFFLGHEILPGGAATAGFKTPNGFGAYLGSGVPVVFLLLLSKDRSPQSWTGFLIFFILIVWALVISSSRGAWLGAVLGIMFGGIILGITEPKKQRRMIFVFMGMMILLYFCWGIIRAGGFDSAKIMRSDTIFWRFRVWGNCLAMIADRPIFGHGINTFMMLFQQYRSEPGTSPVYAHNCYLQLAAETGLLGLGAFLWVMIGIFQKGLHVAFAKVSSCMSVLMKGLLAGIFAFCIHSAFDTNFYSLQLSAYLWVTAGIVMAMANLIDKEPLCG